MKKLAMIVAAGLALCLSACAGGPSLFNKGDSPRQSAAAGMEIVLDATRELTDAAALGVLPPALVADIAEYGPVVRERAAAYLDATQACIVIDGGLKTDPAADGECEASAFKRAFGDLDQIMRSWALSVGVDTDQGRAIYLASVLARRVARPASGDVINGYTKEEDIELAAFLSLRADVATAFDDLLATAQSAAAAQ